MSGATYLLGLVGQGIARSLTPAMQEREGHAQGLAVTYRLVDADAHGFGVDDLGEVLRWAERLGFDGLNITHPFKQAVLPLLDELSDEARLLGAVNTVVLRGGRRLGHNTDATGYGAALAGGLPGAAGDRAVLVGAGGAGVAVGYGLLQHGLARVAVHDTDPGRVDSCVERLAGRFGAERVGVAADLEGELARAGGLVNATPVGMVGHPGLPVPADWVRPDLWVSDVVYFPLETELVRLARDRGCQVLPGGAMAVGQAVGAFELFTGRPADAERVGRHFAEADRLMRTGIATLSLSGRLVEKLEAAAAAGFDGVEVFDADLVACPRPPRDVGRICADLGLAVDLLQPVRDAVGVRPELWPATRRRVLAKLDLAVELGAPVVLLCSHVGADSDPDVARTASQLRDLGVDAVERGLVLAYEALAWGRHVSRLGEAWDVVQRADHPAVTVAVDTFHVLARGDDADTVRGLAGLRVGFLQVADAPTKDMGLLEWSRHFRCFPGQGTLDVVGVVAATLATGYDGPVSLEVFSDTVRETDRHRTAVDGWRSLRYLEDRLVVASAQEQAQEQAQERTPERAQEPGATGGVLVAAPPLPERVEVGFVEVADPTRAPELASLLHGLGFAHAGDHRSKPVQWWRRGEAHVVLDQTAGASPAGHALGLVVPRVGTVSERAAALRWPDVAPPRGRGEAPLPAVGSPGGARLFLSGEPGSPEHWLRDFVPRAGADAGEAPGWVVDHVGVTVLPERLEEEIGFLRAVLGLVPGAVEEFWEPLGRLRSHALRPAAGATRLVVNAAHGPTADQPTASVNQVALRCEDLLAEVPRLRERGVPLMAVPDNYYVDLAARTALPEARVEELRAAGVLHDADDRGGELLHVYTDVLATGFYVELLQRSDGYEGYGSRNTQLRLAVQGGPEPPA